MNSKVFYCNLLVSVFAAATASCDVVLSFDLDTTAPGIQSSRDVSVGETFDVDLLMEITDASSISIYSFGVSFDNSELTVSNTVDVSGRAAGFGQANAVTVDNALGTLHPLDALNFADAMQSPFSGRIARMSVTATNPVGDASADLSPTILRSAVDGFLSADIASIPLGVSRGDGGVFFNAGTLNTTAVPEPSAFLFLALVFGAWGLKGRLRCRHR